MKIKNYIDIYFGCVRIFRNGSISHWDKDLSIWRSGLGVYNGYVMTSEIDAARAALS